ncbi:MAG: type II secretion system GspH family protein [Planctomycetes bacterium]|nr:type II secretion system GspH family protein [Planctomycetota bacterium]
MPQAARAFSLIELLVVIAIVAVLAGMLMPAVGLVRDAAKQAACTTSLRQVAMAFSAYAGDNEDMFPWVKEQNTALTVNVLWTSRVSPYLDSPVQASNGRQGVLTGCAAYRPKFNSGLYGYGMNHILARPTSWVSNWVNEGWQPYGSANFREFRQSAVTYPGNRALLADWEDQHLGNVTTATVGWRHRGRAVTAFVDLHLDAIRKGPPGNELDDATRVRDNPNLGYFR